VTARNAATRILTRAGGLALAIGLFAVVAALFSSETVTKWIGLVGFGTVVIATANWALRDAKVIDLNSSLRDWLVVSSLLGIGWWVAQTLYEGERDVVERLGVDFWSVMSTVGLVFAAAVVGTVMGRGARSAS
jgi:hypothetical protein